ncbi:helix-turn-helix transcriptional regulator [Gemmatimonadota bacterium]
MNRYVFDALMEALDAARHWDLRYVMRPADAARYIGLSEATIRTLHSMGKLPGVKLTDHPRGALGFRRQDLEEYVDNRVTQISPL